MTAGLAFVAIEKSYGATRVLDRVDASFEEGEYVVLVGRSGCGKSTLLRCIAGLEEITSGELFIGGRRVNDLPPKDRDVAMVFQSYALYPHMTVRQNMAFPLEIRKRPRAEIDRAVGEAARMLELEPLLDRKPAQLSGGQRQRVAMGRAVVRRPKIFLFDEPLSNLDASLRHHMRAELKRLHRALGSTIVHVTHDQVEAMTLADRILVLDKGVVQQVGTPRELFDHPKNQFVAMFIGSPSMNLLEVDGHGDHVVTTSGVRLPVAGRGRFTLGFRPTDAEIVPGGQEAVVDVIESLGAEALVHLTLAGRPSVPGPGPAHRVIVQLREPVPVAAGDTVGLRPTVVHRFGPDGQRLTD